VWLWFRSSQDEARGRIDADFRTDTLVDLRLRLSQGGPVALRKLCGKQSVVSRIVFLNAALKQTGLN
jgi:hypothetical protein